MKNLKYPNAIANEYRLIGKGCAVLSDNCITVGTYNVTGGYSFKIINYDPATRTLTLDQDTDFGLIGTENYIAIAVVNDENSPHQNEIIAVDPDAGTLTLKSDINLAEDTVINTTENAVGVVEHFNRVESSGASGHKNLSVGKYATTDGSFNVVASDYGTAIGHRLINEAKYATLVGRYGRLEDSIENEGAFAVAGGEAGDLKNAFVVRTRKKVANPDYNPADPDSPEFIAEKAFSIECNGETVDISSTGLEVINVSNNQTVTNGKLYVADSSGNIDFAFPASVDEYFRFGILAKGTGGITIKSGSTGQMLATYEKTSTLSNGPNERLMVEKKQYCYIEIISLPGESIFFIVNNESSNFFPADKGYSTGGQSTGYENIIQSLMFSSEAINALTATLSSGRYRAAGFNSAEKGYTAGGEIASNTGTSSIDALNFQDETNVKISATLSSSPRGPIGVNSSEKGYIIGGNVYGTGYINTINSLTFENETRAVISATLERARESAAGFNSSEKGYAAGGYYASGSINEIDALTFANETNSKMSATLSSSRHSNTGFNSSEKGYTAGGGVAIDALTFASETNGAITAVLSYERHYAAGFNSSEKGYAAGGNTQAIDALSFVDDSVEVIAAAMSNIRTSAAGFQSGGLL